MIGAAKAARITRILTYLSKRYDIFIYFEGKLGVQTTF